jgi:hypothetical protein
MKEEDEGTKTVRLPYRPPVHRLLPLFVAAKLDTPHT